MGNQCCQLQHHKFDEKQIQMFWPEIASQLKFFRSKHNSKLNQNNMINIEIKVNNNKRNSNQETGLQYREIITSQCLFFGFVGPRLEDSVAVDQPQHQQQQQLRQSSFKTTKLKEYSNSNKENLENVITDTNTFTTNTSTINSNINNRNKKQFTPKYIQSYGFLIDRGDNGNYVGFFKNGQFHGEGKQRCDAYEFEGVFENGQRLNGRLTMSDFTYIGQFKNGQMKGKGQIRFANKDVYVGNIQNGKMEGKGKIKYCNEDLYEGYFRSNLFHGEGVYVWKDGTIYKGGYKNGIKHGYGTLSQNGKIHKFCWVNGRAEGKPMDYQEYYKSQKDIQVSCKTKTNKEISLQSNNDNHVSANSCKKISKKVKSRVKPKTTNFIV